jgi:sporulation protein YlmC with PRC-barrel domain
MQRSDAWLATTLLNQPVRHSDGESLGKIEDIVIDPDSGNVAYAIVSFGGAFAAGSKLFAIPWSALQISPSRDYVSLNMDRAMLERAPGFDRRNWPDIADPAWRNSNDRYYGFERPIVREQPVVREEDIYVERRAVRPRTGMSVVAAILIACLVLGLAWLTFLISTRGWDQAKQDIKSSLQGAAYAAKETSHDAALTARVKTALSLSKRIPSDKIDVDSEGDVVTLRGEVPSNEIRELTESIVRDVPGVGDVHNHLFAVTGNR